MSASQDKAIRSLVRLAECQGWTVTRTRRNHLKFCAPNGGVYFTGSTPSDHRAIKNATTHLRKMGLTV